MSRCWRTPVAPLVAVVVLLASGCASTASNEAARSTWPSGQRWKQALKKAATDRGTWIPLAGAAVVQIDDWDEEIADWAAEETPIFGSKQRARDASDPLWMANQVAMVGTALAVPRRPDEPWGRWYERLLVEEMAVALSYAATGIGKELTDRERPDGSNNNSMPSGHATQGFTQARLACLNVDDMPDLSRGWRIALKTTFTTVGAATAWSRVEGGKHYPSDIMVGAALGNFIAVLIHDAFLASTGAPRLTASVDRDAVFLGVGFEF